MPTKYEEISNVIIIISVVIGILITFISLVLILYYLRRGKSIKRELFLQSQFSQTLLQSQNEIREQTLQHISRELHDNLGQVASLIKINLSTLQLLDTKKAAEQIEDTKNLTRRLIADIKTLSVSLDSDRISRIGLAAAIEADVERLNKTGEFNVVLQLQDSIPILDGGKAVILYRMSQEILNNVVKHSGARHIYILFRVNESVLILSFEDDGIGFNPDEKMKASGAGLRNLASRAILLNAQIHINSLPEKGTSIRIELPI